MRRVMCTIEKRFRYQYIIFIGCISSSILFFAIHVGGNSLPSKQDKIKIDYILNVISQMVIDKETREYYKNLCYCNEKTIRRLDEAKNEIYLKSYNDNIVQSDDSFKLISEQFHNIILEIETCEHICTDITDTQLFLQQNPDLRKKIELLRNNIQKLRPWAIILESYYFNMISHHASLVSTSNETAVTDLFNNEDLQEAMKTWLSVLSESMNRDEKLAYFIWNVYMDGKMPSNKSKMLILNEENRYGCISSLYHTGMLVNLFPSY